MNLYRAEDAVGTQFEGYFDTLTDWVQSLSKVHVGFIPDVFPDHFYITTNYLSDEDDFYWVSLFPLALWQPPRPIGETEADFVFQIENLGDSAKLFIGAKPGRTMHAAALKRKLLLFKLAA